MGVDYVVRLDVRKSDCSLYKYIDLEPLEPRFVATGAPVQKLPPNIGVPRFDSVEPIVCLAKSLLDGLRVAGTRGEA